MSITGTFTVSSDLFLPQRSRYDRPALSLAELLRADGSNFVFQAVWSIEGLRVVRSDHDALMRLLAGQGGKAVVLGALVSRLPEGRTPLPIPGLSFYLMVERRRSVPLVGSILARATMVADQYPALGWPGRFVRSLPGKVRFTYRHGRKLFVRLGRTMKLPSRVEVRRKFGVTHQPAPPEMSERAKWIYEQLCKAVDAPESKAS